jgi:hypothetical protein
MNEEVGLEPGVLRNGGHQHWRQERKSGGQGTAIDSRIHKMILCFKLQDGAHVEKLKPVS